MASERWRKEGAIRADPMVRRSRNHVGPFRSECAVRFFLDEPGERLLEADEITWESGKEDEDRCGLDRQWRHEIFRKYPEEIAADLARPYLLDYEQSGRHGAAYALWSLDRELFDFRVSRLLEDDEIRDLADGEAQRCRNVTAGVSEELAVRTVALVARECGINLPETRTAAGLLARLKCPLWWRRQLRKKHGRATETVAIRLNRVNRRREPYVSNRAVMRRRQQKARTRDLLQGLEAVNEQEESFTLQELFERSVSNPRNRRAELMVRISGLEEVAQTRGYVGFFFTITCPSRMHRAFSGTGKPNPRYDGTTPRKAQGYLRRQWEKTRSKLSRRGIRPYGFRVAEPHHDGTPHWHLLLFVDPKRRNELIRVLRHYALEVDGDEPGADKHRFKVVPIDWNRGTATGYIAKYISKGIDGYGLECGRNGLAATEIAERIVTWASLWGIRQYQQIGGPPVTVWRELRRVRPETLSGRLRVAATAADDNNWARFTELMGGPDVSRKAHPIKLHKAWSDKPGRYGEPLGERIYGLECGSVIAVTRIHTWEIRSRSEPSFMHPVLEHGVGGCGSGSGGSPWPRGARPGRRAVTTTTTRGPRVKDGVQERSARTISIGED